MGDAIPTAALEVKDGAPERVTPRPRGRAALAHLRRLAALLRPYRRRWALATLALVLGGAVNLAIPQTARLAIDRAMAEGDVGALDLIAGLAFGGFVLLGALTLLRHYMMSWLGHRVVADLRHRTFEHLLRFPPGFFHERKTGELTSRLTSDIEALQSSVGSELSMALRSALTAVGGLVILTFTSPGMTGVMLLVVPPLAFVAVWLGRTIRSRARAIQDLVAQANGGLEEALAGIETVQAFGAEPVESRRYRDRVLGAFRAALKVAMARGAFVGSVQIGAFGAVTLIVWLGARGVIEGTLSPGVVVEFLAYTLMVASALATLAEVWGNVQGAVGASERIFELLDEVPTIRDAPDARPLASPRGELVFDGVGFAYPARPDVPVLDDVSFRVDPGETVALVGRSGAGKSTIAALTLRFWDPAAGAVRVDGHDLRALEIESLRGAIATVAQDPVLFSGSVRENIAYGRPDATDEEVRAAARDAHIAAFVETLPDGYETMVGERGVKLSGGQRQRVAIARAILADPRILILDEATSHLDTENEALVHQALERLMAGRTTIVIAHRLSTVKAAHRIVVMDRGRVVEEGTHDGLIARDGLYARLAKSQLEE
ncbi:MAG: ATP-binding cassette domain-containing protein [Myxococcales bacterium]|nr:ATP-binding cassette domain-containing protein [Myxococcales bacterium]MCB9731064.1 ATP-binding cassette domain-containing protein [Deltaproteobacteria bacterium]